MKLYKHLENKDKPYIDWRLPKNRMKGFLMWLDWRLTYGDLDHYVCNNAYRDTKFSPTGKSMTIEQAIWFSLIFGMTYQSEMAWVIYWHFPNLLSINLKELEEWNLENMDKQKYARDTKYNKGRIVEQVKSIQENVGRHGSCVGWVNSFLEEKESDSFYSAYNSVMEFYKFGRMTSWIACQVLFETADVPIRPDTLLAHDQSSWSVRSGLMFLYNRDDRVESTGAVFDKNDIPWILSTEKELYKICEDYIKPENRKIFSNYLLESHLCQYKKLMLGGDFPGHSSGDHVSRANWLSSRWKNVDFSAFYKEAIQHHHPLVRGKEENKELRNICCDTGQIINMHQDYDFMPNLYLEMQAESNNLSNIFG
jgi:hypothetical protein